MHRLDYFMIVSKQPQIYLISPPQIKLDDFFKKLKKIAQKVEISCLRLSLSSSLENNIIETTINVKSLTDSLGIPILIEDHYKLVPQLNLNGVHLTNGSKSVKHVRKYLGSKYIIGAYCGNSKHNALIAAENGADYISMGPLVTQNLGNEDVVPIEIFSWWSEFIEIPIVAEGALNKHIIEELSSNTDFIAITNEIWDTADIEKSLKDLIPSMTAG